MSELVSAEERATTAVGSWQARLLKWGSFVGACSIFAVGVVMIVMCILSSAGIGLKILEIFFGVANSLAGVLLLRESLSKKHAPVVISLWPGEIALAVTFLYFGTSMPIFHEGLASPQIALLQFIMVLLGLIIGTVALVLSGTTKGIRQVGSFRPAASLRDGVILVIGTILVAISLAQLAGPALKPTQWNWISYLGLTVPGMLILIAREGAKQISEHWTGLRHVLSSVVIEIMLICGLAVMLFGSYSNLTLGTNGYLYLLHIKGNALGFTLWATAALFLVLIRGSFKWVFLRGSRQFGLEVLSQILYAAALIAFIYGERSVITGMAPKVIIGSAAPAVLPILLSALLLLVLGRVIGSGRVVPQ